MPIPFLLWGAAALASVVGVGNAVSAISDNSEASDLRNNAEYIYESAKDRLEQTREETLDNLEKLGEARLIAMAEDINSFIQCFSKFVNVEFADSVDLNEKLKLKILNVGDLKTMQTNSLQAAEVVKAGVGALGAGALAGIASYGGVAMFASASTGTAISALSGAAASNATLAWLGGGTIAAGGGGIAVGTLALGGIVLAPVALVTGLIMSSKAAENLAEARKVYAKAKEEVEKIETVIASLKGVSSVSENYINFTSQLSCRHKLIMSALWNIHDIALKTQKKSFVNKVRSFFGRDIKVDFTKLEHSQKEQLHMAWLFTQVFYKILNTPLLDKNGILNTEAQDTLELAENELLLNS